ncbi:ATP-binding protein [Clostridium felsineum]|uniref:ATP-binding protein n=1 Tax=Clostridium felsineum TaxID=36839 RepID=UPI00214D9DA4|nr:ATP-binding protein [Clostridium felsineum]MCR3761499.1 ATP-binding protein [Clostridium felsineum]
MENLSSKEHLKELYTDINKLVVFRELLKDPIIIDLKGLLLEALQSKKDEIKIKTTYYNIIHKLIKAAETFGLKGNLLKAYLVHSIINSKNFFTGAVEKLGTNIERSLYRAALNDIEILQSIMNVNLKYIITENTSLVIDYCPTLNKPTINIFNERKLEIIESENPETMLKKIINYYYEIGSGEMSSNVAFRWENGLVGVDNYDYIELSDIIGYTRQKEALKENTEAFINGHAANNVLLLGSRGTGKSSSVKAMLTEFYSKGLRLVEITKNQLLCFPDILSELKNRGKYFIVFIDDLSFEEGEIEYKQMKSFLDGGIEKVPSNVLVYATSNRRHLIKETWGDKLQNGEELHNSDTVNEKLSLSDRFGLKLTYLSPDQKEYFKIVEGLAKKLNLNIPDETLKKEAAAWALNQNGRSGRTAKQFINYICSRK